jgi:hypothetical protein
MQLQDNRNEFDPAFKHKRAHEIPRLSDVFFGVKFSPGELINQYGFFGVLFALRSNEGIDWSKVNPTLLTEFRQALLQVEVLVDDALLNHGVNEMLLALTGDRMTQYRQGVHAHLDIVSDSERENHLLQSPALLTALDPMKHNPFDSDGLSAPL